MLLIFIQALIILTPFIIGIFFPVQNLLFALVDFFGDSTKLETLFKSHLDNWLIYFLSSIGLSIFIYMKITNFNRDKYFMIGNKYLSYRYLIFWLAAKIFRFGNISLKQVPIYMQFKLVINDTFSNLEVDQFLTNENIPIMEKDVLVLFKNISYVGEELNLILIDTYEINEFDLPKIKVKLPTVIIKSGNQLDGNRTINPEFIKKIRTQTNYYREKFERVNIFATTNTNHTKLIIETCFKNNGRTGFKEVYVYQANKKNYKFNKGFKVVK